MHVVVLMNEPPEYRLLSSNRWLVWELNSDFTHTELTQEVIDGLVDVARVDHEEKKLNRRMAY